MVPQLAALADGQRSLLLAARRARRSAPTTSGPLFYAPRVGHGVAGDGDRGRSRATPARRSRHRAPVDVDRVRRSHAGGSTTSLPTRSCWRRPRTPRRELVAAFGARSSPSSSPPPTYAGVAIVTLAVPALPSRVRGTSGYLVPKPDQRLVTAASFGSQKWAHWRGAGEIVRVSLGRDGLDIDDLDDDRLVDAAVTELGTHLDIDVQPTATRISRWPRSFPQYRPGHLDWLAAVDAATPPGLFLTGAAYRGIGVPACIADAERTGDSAVGVPDATPPSLISATSRSSPAIAPLSTRRRRRRDASEAADRVCAAVATHAGLALAAALGHRQVLSAAVMHVRSGVAVAAAAIVLAGVGATAATAATTTASTTTTTVATTTTLPALPVPLDAPADNEPEPQTFHGRLQIPAIEVDSPFLEGIRINTLDYGPGHWPGTAMPGELGNVVVAGHRTSHNADFRRLDELKPGDQVIFDLDAAEGFERADGVPVSVPDPGRRTPASTSTSSTPWRSSRPTRCGWSPRTTATRRRCSPATRQGRSPSASSCSSTSSIRRRSPSSTRRGRRRRHRRRPAG